MGASRRVPAAAMRVSRGRSALGKRWIYWKRRYSNPTFKDWLMLYLCVAILVSLGLALVDFRLSGWALAGCVFALALVRVLPAPWGPSMRNRGVLFDTGLLVLAGACLAVLASVVPG